MRVAGGGVEAAGAVDGEDGCGGVGGDDGAVEGYAAVDAAGAGAGAGVV